MLTVMRVLTTCVAAACVYGAASEWFTNGETLSRRAAIAILAICFLSDAIIQHSIFNRGTLSSMVWGSRWTFIATAAVVVCASCATVVLSSWWQLTVVLAFCAFVIARRSTLCCCDCCIGCRSRASAAKGGDRKERVRNPAACCRPLNFTKTLLRGLEVCILVLLVPAFAAQSSSLACLPQAYVQSARTIYAMDRYQKAADEDPTPPGGVGTGRSWTPTDGNVLFRTPSDDNATYAAWNPASRSLYFAGTHTIRQFQLDFDIAPRTLQYSLPLVKPDGSLSAACGTIEVSRGFYQAYADVSQQVRDAVTSMLTANSTAPVTLAGFSLGGAAAPLAALDLVCSGTVAASQVRLWTMAGPGAGGASAVGAMNHLQDLGLTLVRVANPLDLVPWMPTFFWEHWQAQAPGGAYLTFSSQGSFFFRAHSGAGYLPAPVASALRMDACAQQRALAWVPVIVVFAIWAGLRAFDVLFVRQRRRAEKLDAKGDSGTGGASQPTGSGKDEAGAEGGDMDATGNQMPRGAGCSTGDSCASADPTAVTVTVDAPPAMSVTSREVGR